MPLPTKNNEGLYVIEFRDNYLTHAEGKIIVDVHGNLDDVAKRLLKEYRGNFVKGKESSFDYLIKGILVKTNRLASPKQDVEVDQIMLVGEHRTGLELLAWQLELPKIPEELFVRYNI